VTHLSARATVVLPTIGRPDLVRQCLDSLAACEPRAAEVLVVDSSVDEGVASVVRDFGEFVRRIHCAERGLGTAFNLGLREARNEIVLLTNDDCTVEPDWVERGIAHVTAHANAIVTGRVRPFGDPDVVPSTIDDGVAREYRGKGAFVLFTQSMALRRSPLLEFGGFDGRVRPSAEDNDLSYRWLRAGRRIRYEPDFVVWHHDWRTQDQLEQLYVGYGIGQGMVYGKHLRRGDLRMVKYISAALYWSLRALIARGVRGSPPRPDPRIGMLRGLPVGLARGWRAGHDAEQQVN
jgi:GT2 family glycosyltransferase